MPYMQSESGGKAEDEDISEQGELNGYGYNNNNGNMCLFTKLKYNF